MPPSTVFGFSQSHEMISILWNSLGNLSPNNPLQDESDPVPIDIPNRFDYYSTAHNNASQPTWFLTIEKALLRPPLLLALYLLDLDHCEMVSVYEEEDLGSDAPTTLMNGISSDLSSPAAMAAFQLWVTDLMESVSCWI